MAPKRRLIVYPNLVSRIFRQGVFNEDTDENKRVIFGPSRKYEGIVLQTDYHGEVIRNNPKDSFLFRRHVQITGIHQEGREEHRRYVSTNYDADMEFSR